MKNALRIFRFLCASAERGEKTALVTVTDVMGQGARAPGTHLAVSSTGASVGSLSGGCVEAAVVSEAQKAVEAGVTRTVRFGVGSPYMDIRLPCGGAMDLLISPEPLNTVLIEATAQLERRETVSLALSRAGGVTVAERPGPDNEWVADTFVATHQPDLRLYILGHGSETGCLARLAEAFGAEVVVISPDDAIVAEASRIGVEAWPLPRQGRSQHLVGDPFSAVVLLFHDHEWESDLLVQALKQDFLLVGAMGSTTTHDRRLEALRALGIPQNKLASIVGPIGLIPGARDTQTLGLSVLGQVVARYEERCSARLSHPNNPNKATRLRSGPATPTTPYSVRIPRYDATATDRYF